MPSHYLILCCPLLLLPSIFPSIRVFSNESAVRIKWPKYWSFSFSISPSNVYCGLISFRVDWFDLLAVQGTLKSPKPQLESISSPWQSIGDPLGLGSSSVFPLLSSVIFCPLWLKPSLHVAPRVDRGREDAQMIYTRHDLTPQCPRSRRMATCSCQDSKPHGAPFAVWVSGCKERKLVLVTFHKVRIGRVWVSPELKLRNSRCSPQEERGPHGFHSLHPFAQDSCIGKRAPDWLAGCL